MKKQIDPTIKAHLIRSAFYVLLLLAVCVIPFALAQRNAKQSAAAGRMWRLGPPASGSPHSNFATARQAGILAMPGNRPVQIQKIPLSTLWYNGDFDGRDGGANQDGGQFGAGFSSYIYDNFTGPPSGQTWTVTGVFSNNLLAVGLNTAITTADWEIRTGVSEGNGGTVVASASAAPATVTATGRSGFGDSEYTVMVTGLNVTLPGLSSGFYFLAVVPVVPSGVFGQSFESTTSGANCAGTPCGNDGNSWWNSNLFGVNFTSTMNLFGSGTWDLSMGVIGTSATPTPTPTPTPSATPRPTPSPRPRPTPPPRP
jgi:hypothetical protein